MEALPRLYPLGDPRARIDIGDRARGRVRVHVCLHHPGAFAVARGYQIPSQQAQKVGAACSHFSRTRKVPPKKWVGVDSQKWVGVDSPFSSVFPLLSVFLSSSRAPASPRSRFNFLLFRKWSRKKNSANAIYKKNSANAIY
jgi:hypothetical protein